MMIEPNFPTIPINRQCELVGLPRSSYYYEPVTESPENLLLMRKIDEYYTQHPFYGSRKFSAWLETQGYTVNRKRVSRLMQLMGIEAIYSKKNLSKPGLGHEKHPYLLKNVTITHPNQVFASDITYIRTFTGFLYLVAIMDWYSRFVLSWRLSNTMDTYFCMRALEEALAINCPEVFNTDQGAQFTSHEFTGALRTHSISISMAGKGRAYDNIFTERLWRSVKGEEVYLKEYMSGQEAQEGLTAYFEFYNNERLHQALQYKTPREVYYGGRP
jgi:putative transposase